MGLSWHEREYSLMVREMEDCVRAALRNPDDNALAAVFRTVSEAKVHSTVGELVNIMIDHGAVDPT